MLADDVGVDAHGRHLEVFAEHVAEAGGVQHGAGADDAVGRQAGELPGGVGQNVDGVGGDEEDAVESVGHDVVDDGLEDLHVLVHQLQPGFAGLLGGAGAQDDERGVLAVGVGAAGDLGAGGGPDDAVVEVHDVALGFALVDVDDREVVADSLVDQGVCVGDSDVAGADEHDLVSGGDLHGFFLPGRWCLAVCRRRRSRRHRWPVHAPMVVYLVPSMPVRARGPTVVAPVTLDTRTVTALRRPRPASHPAARV